MADSSTDTSTPTFNLQRIYLKDASFEVPGAPEIFRADWEPQVDLQLHTASQLLIDGVYEVEVSVTATAKVAEKIAFLAEVKQAGIFTINGLTAEQLSELLNIVCPNILFPYVRETISSLISRGSFPQLLLDPINFEALYAQNQQQNQEALANSTSGEATTH